MSSKVLRILSIRSLLSCCLAVLCRLELKLSVCSSGARGGKRKPEVWSLCLFECARHSVKHRSQMHLPLCRSQLPGGLRRRSAAACLLRLWVRIPPGAWTFDCWECFVCCQVEFSGTSWSLFQRSPTDCGASLCVIQKSREWGGPGPLGAVAPKTNKYLPL